MGARARAGRPPRSKGLGRYRVSTVGNGGRPFCPHRQRHSTPATLGKQCSKHAGGTGRWPRGQEGALEGRPTHEGVVKWIIASQARATHRPGRPCSPRQPRLGTPALDFIPHSTRGLDLPRGQRTKGDNPHLLILRPRISFIHSNHLPLPIPLQPQSQAKSSARHSLDLPKVSSTTSSHSTSKMYVRIRENSIFSVQGYAPQTQPRIPIGQTR